MKHSSPSWLILVAAATLCLPATSRAAELKVLASNAFAPVLTLLGPEFHSRTGDTLTVVAGPAVGPAPSTIESRLKAGEAADVVIMPTASLEDMAKQGKVVPGSGREVSVSYIALAVKAGSAKPDISTVEALKQTLLAAKSIVISGGPSGVYETTVMFPRLGVADQIKDKTRTIAGGAGLAVAHGEAELVLTQFNELLSVEGLTIVGALPASLQLPIIHAAGVDASTARPAQAAAFVAFLGSPAGQAAVRKAGMEPPAKSALGGGL